MALVIRSKSEWATRTDWETNKETITSLYWDQDKSLKEVMETMAQKHEFYATPKMYKYRFRTWGLTKNLKSSEVVEIRSRAHDGALAGPPVVRGREIGSKRLKRQLNRVRSDAVYKCGVHSNALASLPHRLQAPDTLRGAEGSIQAILSYTHGRFENKAWDLSGHEYPLNQDTANAWRYDTELAVTLLEQRRESPEAFELLRDCLDRYETLLLGQEPCLTNSTFTLLLQLEGIGRPEVAESVLRYIANLSRIKLGSVHPFTRLWSNLHAMGLPEARRAAVAIMSAYYDVIWANTQPGSNFRTLCYLHTVRVLCRYGEFPTQAADALYAKTIQEISDNRQNEIDDVWLKASVLARSFLIHYKGKNAEADSNPEVIRRELHKDPQNGGEFGKLKGRISAGLGNYDEAIVYSEKFLELSRSQPQGDLMQTMRILFELHQAYRFVGDVEVAERAREEFKDTWKDLMSMIRAIKLRTLQGCR